MIENFINPNGNFNKFLNAINSNDRVSVFGLSLNEQTSAVSTVQEFIFYVAPDNKRAEQIKEKLEGLGRDVALLTQRFNSEFSTLKPTMFLNNLKTLMQANDGKINAIVATPETLVNFYDINAFNQASVKIEVDTTLDIRKIISQLVEFGYSNTDFVESEGQFSTRGDLLDIYGIGDETPHRISFAFNEVEFIKPYNIMGDAIEIKNIDTLILKQNITIDASSNVLDITINEIDKQLKTLQGDSYNNLDQIKHQLKSEQHLNTTFLHAFNNSLNANIFACLPKNTIIVFDEQKQVYDNVELVIKNNLENLKTEIADGYLLPLHKNSIPTTKDIFNFLPAQTLVAFGNLTSNNRMFTPNKVFSFKTMALGNYVFNSNLLTYDMKHFAQLRLTVILFAGSKEFAEKLSTKLNSAGISNNIVSSVARALKGNINIVEKQNNQTYALADEGVVVVGTSNLLKSANKTAIIATKSASDTFLNTIPNVGDYVVHTTHGIGQCVEVTKIRIANNEKDYVVVLYKGGDKLFLPVENLDSISKYLGGDEIPKLNKLGGAEFYKTKQKIKSELKEAAFSLMELYAKRGEHQGIVFDKDDDIQEAFENDFAYTETPHQMQAIIDVKSDMQSTKIMDRLICGDVGYGKTEVALRAIFKAVNSGYQVAFLCPTTILSQQHYNLCIARMKEYGVNVEVLNRFKTKSEQTEIVKKINSGEVNIICGTHRILSSDIKFKNLGLLVLDEEQKFGVSDKEKIKNLKTKIDVLTLSATPIPRSLHMALVGIRDISVIETPPPMKLPVITNVVEYKDELVQGAIKAELDRGGQVLIVFNNIGHIYNFRDHIQKLAGEYAVVSVAHGQMAEHQLENEIFNLYNGKTNVLVATTLIENGVDLPSANTLIIINSDMLGLSQLYQLKGRVGRAGVQAYAYFTFDKNKSLNENAYKRLEAINEFSSLGDGYKIAMRDLEIRGAGNVFGTKQSGHMVKVGYAMYVNLLKDAVAELKGEKVKKIFDFKIDSEFSANLPNYYLASQALRLKMFNDIAKISTLEELNNFIETTTQNYGEVPPELVNLCYIALIKNTISQMPLKRLVLRKTGSKIEFLSDEQEFLQKLMQNASLGFNKLPIIELNAVINLQQLYNAINKLVLIINSKL